MHKGIKTILTLSAAAVLFSACHDNLFESINNEVKLESNGINGAAAISRYADYILFPTGQLYYKTNVSSNTTGLYNRQWKRAQLPETEKVDYIAGQCYYAVSDSANLYITIHSWYENSSGYNSIKNRQIFTTTDTDFSDGIEWTEITLDDTITPIKLFMNNAVDESNRIAYMRAYDSENKTYKIYKMNGTSAPEEITDDTTGLSTDTITAVFFPKDGKTYFSKYYSLTANDEYMYYTNTYSSSGTMATGSSIYRANGYGTYYTYSSASDSDVTEPSAAGWYEKDSDGNYVLTSDTEKTSGKTYYTRSTAEGFLLDSEAASSTSCDAGGIISIAVTSNYLLLGTTSGLSRVVLSSTGSTASLDNIPYTSSSSFSNNGDSIITEYGMSVFTLDPTAAEGDDDEYVASVIYGSISGSSDNWNDTGLYAFYKNRGTWNRDGTSDNSSNGN